MSLGGIAMRFGVLEGWADRQYNKQFGAPSAKELDLEFLLRQEPTAVEVATGVSLSPEEAAADVRPVAVWQQLYQQFLVDPYGLRREAFAADLAKAAPNMKNRIDIIVPDQSWLNDPRDVATAVIGLGDVPGVSAQVTQWNLLGHTHANLNQPSSLAAVYTADLT